MSVENIRKLRLALQESLAFVDRFVAPFDERELRVAAHLPGSLASWDDILSRTPSHQALRSEALRPAAQRVHEAMMLPEPGRWVRELDTFQAQRREWLNRAGEPCLTSELDWQRELSRPEAFVVFQPDSTLSDHAAWVASNGYLDVHNCPPWDTWLMPMASPTASSGSCSFAGLLCWVPQWAHDFVEAGIQVNPENCIFWAEIQDDQISWREWGDWRPLPQ